MGEWQPIETAPKDGTIVLLWAAAWDSVRTGWTFAGDEWQDTRSTCYPPTHWMLLPVPPPVVEP